MAQGRIAFHGAIDEAIHHFSSCGYQVPDHTNPADYFIDVSFWRWSKVDESSRTLIFSKDPKNRFQTLAIKPSEAEACKSRCQELCDKFEKSFYNERLTKLMDQTKDVRAMTPHHSATYPVLLYALFYRFGSFL